MAKHCQPQSYEAMENIEQLEWHSLSEVALQLREHFDILTNEQEQDLLEFETGKIDFETVYSKYWSEDRT